MSDLISREAAKKAIGDANVNFTIRSNFLIKDKNDIAYCQSELREIVFHILQAQRQALDELPSAEPKKGKWIDNGPLKLYAEMHDFKCSECSWHEPDFPERIHELYYCARCGADMREAKDENSKTEN